MKALRRKSFMSLPYNLIIPSLPGLPLRDRRVLLTGEMRERCTRVRSTGDLRLNPVRLRAVVRFMVSLISPVRVAHNPRYQFREFLAPQCDSKDRVATQIHHAALSEMIA